MPLINKCMVKLRLFRPSFVLLLFPLYVVWESVQGLGHIAKKIIIRRWSKDLAVAIRLYRDSMSPLPPAENPVGCKNIAGLGGQAFHPLYISWNELMRQSDNAGLQRWVNHPTVIRESLFYEYFGPLEAWCDDNCQGSYYLWSDDRGIYCVITDPVDLLLWQMIWNNTMPSIKDLNARY